MRLGCTLDQSHPMLIDADQRVAAACKKHGRFWGRPATNEEDIKNVASLGAGFINYGSDFMGLFNLLSEAGEMPDRVIK